MTRYILFHASCADGFGAALAAWLKFGKDAEYIPVQYGNPFPDIITGPGTEVYILDFSYPTAKIKDLVTSHDRVVVLDHHATARTELEFMMEEYNQEPFLIKFAMNKSGAVMAWEYFQPGLKLPDLFRYLQDRDLWQWKLPMSREVSAAIGSYPYNFKIWEHFAGFGTSTCDFGQKSPIEVLQGEGVGIRRMTKQIVESAASKARFAIFLKGKEGSYPPEVNFRANLDSLGDEYSVYWASPALNCTAFISETCERMLELHPKAKFVATYFDSQDGKRIWSLRSRPDYDCSVIAKHFGGGGHKQASGFTQTIRVNRL